MLYFKQFVYEFHTPTLNYDTNIRQITILSNCINSIIITDFEYFYNGMLDTVIQHP